MSRLESISDWPERAEKAKFNFAGLAGQCGVSERQLRRFLEGKFRVVPHIWIMNERLDRAPELLESDLILKEVADLLGFTTEAHFSRQFRKRFGNSPRAYRAKLRSKGRKGPPARCPI